MGFGFEAASIGELRMAGRASKDAFIVYDSPLKSRQDIVEALEKGVLLNVDNFQELSVVAQEIDRHHHLQHNARVGVRVNPQVGAGSLAGFSTGTRTSKFGIGMRDDGGGDLIVDAYCRHQWMRTIMCHIGSQGIPFDLAIEGIKATVDFAKKINDRIGHRQVDTIDIGGGMSVNFASDERKPTFDQYAEALRSRVPELFDPSVFPGGVITEFGRALAAKCGHFASRVEYVKMTGGRRIVLQYAGADTCVRTVYHPKEWPLRVSVLRGPHMQPVGGDGVSHEISMENSADETDVAGPCCIQADIVAHQRMLPRVQMEDTVLLHDTGAYYHSGHTRYNLRQAPSVWAYEDDGAREGQFKFTLLQPAETVEQTLDAFCEPGWQNNL